MRLRDRSHTQISVILNIFNYILYTCIGVPLAYTSIYLKEVIIMANTATVKSAEVFEVSDERNEPMVVPEETKSYLDNMKDALEGIGWIKKYFAGECDIPEHYQHKEADKVETSNGANKESSKAEQAKALNASVVEAVEHAFSDDESTLAETRE